uniref:Uncharacterized protein n=1 Tax=Triticum urartu TaxID=4572 RepID=A0A8R7PAI1_TRIUA
MMRIKVIQWRRLTMEMMQKKVKPSHLSSNKRYLVPWELPARRMKNKWKLLADQ